MKIRKEYAVLIALIILLGLYLFFRDSGRSTYQIPELAKISAEDVTGVEIEKQGSRIKLNRKGEDWIIEPGGYSPDANKVDDMLWVVENFALTAVVSETESYHRYELDDAQKISVRVWVDEKLEREFAIGKSAPTYRHTFVALNKDHRTYHAQGNFRNRFDQSIDDLRDKTVLSFDKNDIQKITVTAGADSMIFVKKAGASGEDSSMDETPSEGDAPSEGKATPTDEPIWENAQGEKGDRAKISSMVEILSSFQCERYLEEEKRKGLKAPIFSIQLTGSKPHALSIYPKADDDAVYPATSSANPYLFGLSENQVDRIMKSPGDLLVSSSKKDAEPDKAE